jgi:bifunctional non-homologous end joining protein LigD
MRSGSSRHLRSRRNGIRRSDFGALQSAIQRAGHRLVYFAFDLLQHGGADLRDLPLLDRKAALAEVLGPADPTRPIQLVEHWTRQGAAMFGAADRLGLEGIVSKRTASRYVSGRSRAWLKSKCMIESEFVVVGFERKAGEAPFALLARETDDGPRYAGSAFVTLPQPQRGEFWARVEALAAEKPLIRSTRKDAVLVRPALGVRAKHLRGEGGLRQ